MSASLITNPSACLPLCLLLKLYVCICYLLTTSSQLLCNFCLSAQWSCKMSASLITESVLLRNVCSYAHYFFSMSGCVLIRITQTACLHLFSAHYLCHFCLSARWSCKMSAFLRTSLLERLLRLLLPQHVCLSTHTSPSGSCRKTWSQGPFHF